VRRSRPRPRPPWSGMPQRKASRYLALALRVQVRLALTASDRRLDLGEPHARDPLRHLREGGAQQVIRFSAPLAQPAGKEDEPGVLHRHHVLVALDEPRLQVQAGELVREISCCTRKIARACGAREVFQQARLVQGGEWVDEALDLVKSCCRRPSRPVPLGSS